MAAKPSITDGCWDKVSVSDVENAESFTVKLAGSEVSQIIKRVYYSHIVTPTVLLAQGKESS